MVGLFLLVPTGLRSPAADEGIDSCRGERLDEASALVLDMPVQSGRHSDWRYEHLFRLSPLARYRDKGL